MSGAPSASPLAARLAPYALLAPALVVAVVFFGLPTLYMLRMSFNVKTGVEAFVPGFTFDHYLRLLGDELYVGAMLRTIRLSLVCAFVTLVLGYAFALLVWLKPPAWRVLFIGLALCPLLISEISIIFGWWMFFPKNGLLSWALVSTGIMADKISLMYTEFAALVGLIYLTLPFCFFMLLSTFDGIDRRLLEASADLGARPLQTFADVLLPLTRSCMLVAFAQSFIWAIGTYATPTALGPDTLWTMGYLIQDQMVSKRNWPFAAALSMVLVTAVALVMILTRGLMARRTHFHA